MLLVVKYYYLEIMKINTIKNSKLKKNSKLYMYYNIYKFIELSVTISLLFDIQ